MHFWIDKPAGRCYGFNGRRYPTMSFSKAHFGQRRRYGNLDISRLQMITPVHRFQNTNINENSIEPSNLNSIRSIRQTTQNNNYNRNSSTHTVLQLEQNISNNTSSTDNNNQQMSRATSTANRGLINFSQLSNAEMAGYRLRCSVWITFVLATGFVAAAKFYFDHQQGAGLEILVFCGLLVILMMSGCFYSIICRRTQSNNHPESQVEPIATVTVTNTIPTNSIRPVSNPVRLNPPPPYHIAILIPPSILSDEAPPPAYDKIIK